MKQITKIFFFLLFLSTISFSYNHLKKVDGNSKKIVPGKFVVKYKKSTKFNKISQSALANTVSKYNVLKHNQIFKSVKNLEVKEKLNLSNVYIMETSIASDIWNIVKELNNDNNVEYAEPVYIEEMEAFEPNDPLYSSQQHLPQIMAPEAWDIALGDSTVIIGVIDSGVDWDHEDLENVIWSNEDEIPDNGFDDDNNGYIDDIRGWDFVTGVSGSGDSDADPGEDGEDADNNPMDYNGHGTHVAGIAAAQTNNGIGISSVSAGVRVMPLRIGWQTNDGNGLGQSNWMAEAYIYAADNGAHITNLSYGNSGQLIVDAARYAFMNGVLIVESAGNGNATDPSALGTQSFAISVGAVNMDDEKTYYSSFGEYVTVSAPGGELFSNNDTDGILSTIVNPSPFYNGSKYVKFQGTSMAAPLVASVAGLIKSHEPNLNVVDLFTRIVETADNVDGINPLYEGKLGSGRVNVYRALTELVTADPNFIVIDSEIDDQSGNNNGWLDPGEQVVLRIKIRNIWQNADGVTANLSTNNPEKITINSGSASLGNISGIVDTSNWEKVLDFDISCSEDALPTSVKLNINLSSSGFNQVLEYNLAISPRVLFISDFDGKDNELYDFSTDFLNALNENKISYDFLYHSRANIDYSLLSKYKIVIWGCEWTFPSLDSDDRIALSQFLDAGGSLFLSGQDIAWELTESSDNQDITFLNNYLKSDFISDNAGRTEILGVDNDEISDGLSFDFYQKKRSEDQQFPDVIRPIDSALPILNYDFGEAGAIKYSGDFRLVYFGFGGFESVTDSQTKNILMSRIIDFLDGIEIDHKPLKDSENTTEDYYVSLTLDSPNDTINDVIMLYSFDEEISYTKIKMELNDNIYSASIPAQSTGTKISYYFYVETSSRNYSFSKKYNFKIGDEIGPEITSLNRHPNSTINPFGISPFYLNYKITDNITVDTANVKLFYWINENPTDSLILESLDNDQFRGTFSFLEPLQINDKVSFYVSANDKSLNQNMSKSDTSFYFYDSTQVIDDFETGLEFWDLGNGWDIVDFNVKNGKYSITDSPEGKYKNNESNPLTYLLSFDLSLYKSANLKFYIKHFLDKDSLLVQLSNNQIDWATVDAYSGVQFGFKEKTVDISDYTGEGNNSVYTRFVLTSDDDGVESDGVFIDDISILASFSNILTNVENQISLPTQFALNQNYPNPFNPSTTISFSLPQKSDVSIKIYNNLGQLVETLYNGETNPGYHDIVWNANVASGVYYYTIKAGDFVDSKKMVFLK